MKMDGKFIASDLHSYPLPTPICRCEQIFKGVWYLALEEKHFGGSS